MVHVPDLKLEEDTLPFFNYTNNYQAEIRVLSLLKELPETKAEVLERHRLQAKFVQLVLLLSGLRTYVKVAFSSGSSPLPVQDGFPA